MIPLSFTLVSIFDSSKMDPKKVMNLEKGFELDPIWSEFNAEFRGLMRKKFEK